jgi:hypothetical protein
LERLKRVYVSVPRDSNLDDRQKALKHAILDRLQSQGIEPQEFHVSGLPLRMPYTLGNMTEVMARCHGALILALARWKDPTGDTTVAMPTVWNHFEGALAVAHKKEILVITEKHVAQDGITWQGAGQIVLTAPPTATPAWLDTPDPKRQIDAWIKAVKGQKDVFLAYSSEARATANDISKFLSSRGVSVLDWELFTGAGNLLQRIQESSKKCLGAIMLLTKSDELVGAEGNQSQAAPRDNVIFEMGLFMEAKGRERVLVIREEGTKMPADIGGEIYLLLKNRNDISPIHSKLLDFVDERI